MVKIKLPIFAIVFVISQSLTGHIYAFKNQTIKQFGSNRDFGPKVIGIVSHKNSEVTAPSASQISIDTNIKSYDWPVVKTHLSTSITSINFSNFTYEFPLNAVEVANISYDAPGALCSLNETSVVCSGGITSFTIAYDYAFTYISEQGFLRYIDGLRTYGFTFEGNFRVTFPAGSMTFKSSETITQFSFPSTLIWRTGITDYARNSLFFELSCLLTDYTASNIVGLVTADVDFVAALNRMNEYARSAEVKLLITQSVRRSDANVDGAIVPPAEKSNHLAGHAIDFNVLYGPNYSNLCNSTCLGSISLPKPVKKFFDSIAADPTLRWGKTFTKVDPVHVDDHLNKSDAEWSAKFQKVQQNIACRVGNTSPTIFLNFNDGRPGSHINIFGFGYSPNGLVYLYANERGLGSFLTDSTGQFNLLLKTLDNLALGRYLIKVTDQPQLLSNSTEVRRLDVSAEEHSLGFAYLMISDSSELRLSNSLTNTEVFTTPDGLTPLKIVYLPSTGSSLTSEVGP